MKERRLHGRKYWELWVRLHKTEIMRFTKKKREGLKVVYIRAKRR